MSEIIEGPYKDVNSEDGWEIVGPDFFECVPEEIDASDLNTAYAQGQASKEARVKELEEKLKVAEEALNGISVLALSRPNAEIIADEALKKLKG